MKVAVLDDYTGWVSSFDGWAKLAGIAEITFFTDHLSSEDEIVERLRDFDVIVIERERTPFPRSLLARLPNLKHLASTGPVNWSIDLAAAKELGITVSCTRGTYDETPELAWALILGLARRVTFEEQGIRAGKWQIGIGTRLAGKTLGVLGLGKVGRRVAEFGICFKMNVIAWSQNLTAEQTAEAGVGLVDLDGLLTQSDILTVHVVLSERTRGLIGQAELAQMKPTSLLINTSRSPIVDSNALGESLKAGRLAGAALDVFPTEPLPATDPLRDVPNLMMTPHIGYITDEHYQVFYSDVVENIVNYSQGKKINALEMK